MFLHIMKKKLSFSLAFLLMLGFGLIGSPYSALAEETKTISIGETVSIPVQKIGGDFFAYLEVNEIGTYIIDINWGSEISSANVEIRNEADIFVQGRELGISTTVASAPKLMDDTATYLQFPVWQVPEPKKVAILISYEVSGIIENPTSKIEIGYSFKERVSTDTFSGSFQENQPCDTRLFSLPAPSETGYYNITVSTSSGTYPVGLRLFDYLLGIVNSNYLFSANGNSSNYIAYLQKENPVNGSIKICRGFNVPVDKKSDYNAEIKLEKISPKPLATTSTEDLAFFSMENTDFDALKINGTGTFAIFSPFGQISGGSLWSGGNETDIVMFPIVPDLPNWQLEVRNTLEPFLSFPLNKDLEASVFVSKKLEISTDNFYNQIVSARFSSDWIPRLNGTENLYVFDGMFNIKKSTIAPLTASSSVSFDPTDDGIPIFQFSAEEGKSLEGIATIEVDKNETNYFINGAVNAYGSNFVNSYDVIRSDQTQSPSFPLPMLSGGTYYIVPSFNIYYRSSKGVSFENLKKPVTFEFNITDIPQLEFDKETTLHTGFSDKYYSNVYRIPTAKLMTFDVKAGESFYLTVDVGVASSSSIGVNPLGSYAFVSFVDKEGYYPFYEVTPAFAGFGISYFGQVFTAVRDAKVYTWVYGFGDVNVTIVKVGSADIKLPISTDTGGGFLPAPFLAFLSAIAVVPLIINKKRKK